MSDRFALAPRPLVFRRAVRTLHDRETGATASVRAELAKLLVDCLNAEANGERVSLPPPAGSHYELHLRRSPELISIGTWLIERQDGARPGNRVTAVASQNERLARRCARLLCAREGRTG